MILEQINGPEELKALPPEDLKILAQEIRTFLIEKISHTGGHLLYRRSFGFKPGGCRAYDGSVPGI